MGAALSSGDLEGHSEPSGLATMEAPTSKTSETGRSRKRKAIDRGNDDVATPESESSRKRGRSEQPPEPLDDIVPFRIDYPIKREKWKNTDVFVDHFQMASLDCHYAISPGSAWRELVSYDIAYVNGERFELGSLVYIHKSSPAPSPLPEDATAMEQLKFDRQYFWIGLIRDIRANEENDTYLQVFWLYWPEELPTGRQRYHSEHELILSNHTDIVSSETLGRKAVVYRFDHERVSVKPDNVLFWRQTFDVGKQGKKGVGCLSKPKSHCRCRQPINPDTPIYECKNTMCATLNHEKCVIDNVYHRIQRIYKSNGTLGDLDISVQTEEQDSVQSETLVAEGLITSVEQTPTVPKRDIIKDIIVAAEMERNQVSAPALLTPGPSESPVLSPEAAHSARSRPPPHTLADLKAKFHVKILMISDVGPIAEVKAVENISTDYLGPDGKRLWMIRALCLQCGTAMDAEG